MSNNSTCLFQANVFYETLVHALESTLNEWERYWCCAHYLKVISIVINSNELSKAMTVFIILVARAYALVGNLLFQGHHRFLQDMLRLTKLNPNPKFLEMQACRRMQQYQASFSYYCGCEAHHSQVFLPPFYPPSHLLEHLCASHL